MVNYTYDRTLNNVMMSVPGVPNFVGTMLTVNTVNQGVFSINMLTGAYTYIAPPLLAISSSFNESIGCTITDNDDDSASGTLTLEVKRAALSRSFATFLDFQDATFSGSFSHNIPVTSLGDGTWRTDNISGYIEVGLESSYFSPNTSVNKVMQIGRSPGDPDNLYTDVATVAGEIYSLTFDYGWFNALAGYDSTVYLYWGGVLIDTLTDVTLNHQLVRYNYTLTANATGTTRLEFVAKVNTNDRGGILDNITLILQSVAPSQTYTTGYVNIPPVTVAGIVSVVGNVANVSERVLTNGISSAGDPFPQAHTVIGTLTIDQNDRALRINPPIGTYTCGGLPILWDHAPSAFDLIGYAGAPGPGNEVIIIHLTAAGRYTVELKKPIDHPPGLGSNITPISFGIDWVNELVVYDIKLFTPGCPVRERGPFDTDSYDWSPIYPTIIDDMYLTVTYQDTSEVRVRHHVALHPSANFYQEPAHVNDLIMQAPTGDFTDVVVYHQGSIIVPDSITIDGPMIHVAMNTARSVAIELIR